MVRTTSQPPAVIVAPVMMIGQKSWYGFRFYVRPGGKTPRSTFPSAHANDSDLLESPNIIGYQCHIGWSGGRSRDLCGGASEGERTRTRTVGYKRSW